MWSAKSEIADLYLSGRTLAIRASGKVLLHPVGEDWTASLQACLSEWPGRRWRVWLGGRLCGLHLSEPIAGIRSIEEAEAALGASLSLDGRAVSVRLARWSVQGPWLALATEARLIERLMSTVENAEGHVHSVRPWWTMLGNCNSASVAMCDDEAITYWRVELGVFTSAATLWAAEDQQRASLQRLGVSGALKAWRLEFDAPTGNRAGMAASPMDEGVDAAA